MEKDYAKVYDKNWIKEGQEIAQVDNLNQLMRVEELIKRVGDVPDPNNPEKKITKKKFYGVRCHWWYNGQLIVNKFHKDEIVPWEVAMGGNIEVIRFQTAVNQIPIK